METYLLPCPFMSSSPQTKSEDSAPTHDLIQRRQHKYHMCRSAAPVSNNLVAVLNFLVFTNREAADGECKIEKNAQANNSMLSLGA